MNGNLGENIRHIMNTDIIEQALGRLTLRERRVIEIRFGLTDGIPHTLEDVGNVFGCTRERIRQIEAKALKKMRRAAGREEWR